MAVYCASGSFNAGSSSPGAQACTDPVHGSFRPKLIWFIPVYGGGSTCYMTFGAAAEDAEQNVTQVACAMRSGDGQSAAQVRTARYDTRAFIFQFSGALGAEGTVSIGDTGFTPSLSTTVGNVDFYWIALGGDVEEGYCVAHEVTSAQADGISPVAVPFAPDVVMAFASSVSASKNANANGNGSWTFGWSVKGGAEYCTASRHVNSADPTTVWTSQVPVLYRGLLNGTAFDLTVDSWESDGVDLAVVGTPPLSTQYVFLVFARGGQWADVAVDGNGESTQAVATTGVNPVAVLAQTWARASSSSIVDGDVLYSLGMATGASQVAQWASDDDGAATTNADGTYTTDSLIYIGTVDAPATVQAEAALDGFESEAVNLAWSPADSVGREILMLVVGDEVAAEITLAASGSVGAIAGAADLSVGEPGIELLASGSMGGLVGDAKLTVPHMVRLTGGLVMGGIVTAYHGLALAASGAVGSASGTASLTSTLPLAAAGAIGSQEGAAALTVELGLAAAGVAGAVDGEAALTSDLPLEAAGVVGALAGSAALTAGAGELELAAAGVIGQVGGSAALSTALGLAASGAVGAMAGGARVTTDLPLVAAGALAAFGGTADISSGLTLAASGTIAQFAGSATVTTTLDLQAAGTVGAVAGAAALSVEEAVLALAAAGAVGVFGGTARVTSTMPLVAQGALGAVAGIANLSVAVIPAAILLGGPITQRRITVGTITQRGQQAS